MTKTTTEKPALKGAKTKKADSAAAPKLKTAETGTAGSDAAAATRAGLTATEAAALDPANRAPVGRLATDDADGTQYTEEEIEAAKGAEQVTLLSVNVQIERDPMIKTTVRVFEHEIPILEQLHGPDRIEVDDESVREETVTLSADQEFERLARCRGEKGREAAAQIYPNARALATELGLKTPNRTRVLQRRLGERQQSAQRGAGV